MQDASKHSFSHHDNRQAFLNDPTLFGSGIGKKKIDSVNKSKWDPEFIAWKEKAVEVKKESIYQHDFCRFYNSSKLLTGRKSVENRAISVYEYEYKHGEPTPETAKSQRLETYYRYLTKSRAKSITPNNERVTVANCLVWHNPAINNSTKTQDLNKHSNYQDDARENNVQSRPKTVAVCSKTIRNHFDNNNPVTQVANSTYNNDNSTTSNTNHIDSNQAATNVE